MFGFLHYTMDRSKVQWAREKFPENSSEQITAASRGKAGLSVVAQTGHHVYLPIGDLDIHQEPGRHAPSQPVGLRQWKGAGACPVVGWRFPLAVSQSDPPAGLDIARQPA